MEPYPQDDYSDKQDGDSSANEDDSSYHDHEIPEDKKICLQMKLSNYENRPPTVYFQYSSDFSAQRNLMGSLTRIKEVEITDRKYCVMYKAYKNLPECLSKPMSENGIIRTKAFLKANVIWKLLKYEKMMVLVKKLNKYQRFNHFPMTWQLSRKDNLWKNYKKMKDNFTDDYNYMPVTYILPNDSDAFMAIISPDYQLTEGNMWLIKPVASSRGRGIRLMINPDNIPQKAIVTKYIHNPHTINNKKYDLRLYVLITGYSPLKIYLYEEGLVRFASEEYTLNCDSIHNRYIHLTNYSINKCSTRFDKNVSSDNECQGSKWSLSALRSYFSMNSLDFPSLWQKIKDILVKTVLTVTEDAIKIVEKVNKNRNIMFELYGFDILIDDTLTPWLIEVNLNPSLNCDTELDLKVKSCLLTDIFNIIGITPFAHGNTKSKLKDPLILHISNNETTNGVKPFYFQDDDENCVMYSLDEFSRSGPFQRVFPVVENIDYYSKFISNPGISNRLLWENLKPSYPDYDDSHKPI